MHRRPDGLPPRLVISGIPATGKTTFSEWLVANAGFVRHNPEVPGVDPFPKWNWRQRVVVDWGFPADGPDFLPAIERLRDAERGGYELWWFDGNHATCRQSFNERDDFDRFPTQAHKDAAWDAQVGGIVRNWDLISSLYVPKDRIIQTILPPSVYVPPEMIVKRIEPKLPALAGSIDGALIGL